MPKWLQKNCTKCGGAVMYLEHWTIQPNHCNACKLRLITDIPQCLEQFLGHEDYIAKRIHSMQERAAFADRQRLRTKVSKLLADNQTTLEALQHACEHDKEVLRLIFRVAKERKIPDKSASRTRIIPKHIAPFLQGGSPGLGKR